MKKRINERFLRKYWNKASKDYNYNRWKKNRIVKFDYLWTRKALLERLDPREDESILEMGCGPGTWTGIVGKKARKLTAIDVSDEMVGLARKVAPGAEFHVCDARRFRPGKRFDSIFSVRVIEYVHNKDRFVNNAYSLLKDRGKIVMITKSRPCLWDITSRSEWQKKVSPLRLKKMMREAGFKGIKFYPVSIRFPIFKRGVYEAGIIPERLESKALGFFHWLTKEYNKAPVFPSLFTLFSESYIISAYK